PGGPAGASHGDHVVAHEVEPDDFRGMTLVEVAAHGVVYLRVQLGDGVGLREDRRAERAGRVAALWCLLHQEDHLVHVARHPTTRPPRTTPAATASLHVGEDTPPSERMQHLDRGASTLCAVR